MAGATQSSSSMLAICSVTETRYKITDAGAVADGTNIYYFQSSSIYADTAIATATGITYINPDKWTGAEPLIKVEQMILSGKLERIYAELENPDATKANKVIAMFCTPEKLVTVKTAATGIVDKTLKTTRGGVTKTLGKCFGVRGKTSNRYR